MKLIRYELYCDEEPQDVGFIVGLNALVDGPFPIMSDTDADMLVEPFNDDLPYPNPNRKDVVCLFTELGQLVFEDAINSIITAYEGSMFSVKQIILEFPDDEKDKLPYEDKWQVCLDVATYKQLALEYERFKKFVA